MPAQYAVIEPQGNIMVLQAAMDVKDSFGVVFVRITYTHVDSHETVSSTKTSAINVDIVACASASRLA